MVNEGSASASEIVSGAIKDNKRGKLVGKKTFGKGLVQSMRTLVDGSGLTVTVAKYLTPNGTDINKFGIIPDIEGCKCNECPYMKLNTLEKILDCLKNNSPSIELDPEIIRRAYVPIKRMLDMSN